MSDDEHEAPPWWHPSPVTGAFLILVLIDVALLWWASGITYSGNDPEGNGMMNGFGRFVLEIEACVVGAIALLFLSIWHHGVRVALLILLATLNLIILSLAAHG